MGRGHVSPELSLSLWAPSPLGPRRPEPSRHPGILLAAPSAQGRLLPVCVGQALLTPSPARAEFKSEDAWDRCLLLEDPRGLGHADKQGLRFSAGFLDTHLVCVIRGPSSCHHPRQGRLQGPVLLVLSAGPAPSFRGRGQLPSMSDPLILKITF